MNTGITKAVDVLRLGGLIAYPTEAVYGLGCDPANETALARLIALKQRDAAKGMILIASDYAQLKPYLLPPDQAMEARMLEAWPGPVTWLVPARDGVSELLRGAHRTLAVRVTAHAQSAAICRAFGAAITSTSANLSGHPPASTAEEVRTCWHGAVDFVLEGAVGGAERPTEIRDLLTGRIVRA